MKAPKSLFLVFLLSIFCILLVIPGYAQITPPEEYLGFKPGADFHLQTYEQAIGYYEHIAAQTDRMQVFDMGPTSEGRRMKYAVISSEENMANLDRYKEINRKLSLVRELNKEEAERLSEQGKAIVWIDGGLHATEVAPAQLMVRLAYELASGEDAQTRFIRDNVIALLVYANPDGMTIVSDWYMKNVGTPYEISPVPWLYHKYVGHDNNRDSFMSNIVETQNINRVTNHEWFPEIVYNQHQRGPFPARIWIPPEAEPMNPNLHPLIARWKNLVGAAMGKAFEEADQPGAISRIRYDSWYPGYVTQVVEGHNIVPILTETQLYGYATPHFYTINDFPEAHRDLVAGTFYPNPWQGGWWHIGDAVDYNRTACFAVLDAAAKYRREFLLNKYVSGSDVIEKFKSEPPYGWIIPANQRDLNTTSLLIDRLMLNGIEVYEAETSFNHDGIAYPEGSYVIPTSQPFGYFAKNLLEKQQYPDLRQYVHLWQGLVSTVRWDGSPLRPYDGVGWTLPAQLGIEFREMSKVLDIPLTKLAEAPVTSGSVEGSGSHFIFSHADNHSFFAVDKIMKAGGRVRWALEDFISHGTRYPKGTFFVDRRSISSNNLSAIASETGVTLTGGSVNVKSILLKKPRIALYKSWNASMDMGWMTYIFDQYGYDVHLLTDAEVKAGELSNRFDVIVLPDQRPSSIIEGHRKGTIHPDYVGGITLNGVSNLKSYVKKGGVLVCNNGSTGLPLEYFDIQVRNILEDVKPDSFNCPGSILNMNYDTGHPVAFGMQEQDIAYFSRGSVFEIIEEESEKDKVNEDKPRPTPKVVASYPESNLLYSGWILGEERIAGKPAILDVPFGQGRVILFGFNVHNRAQARSTFKLFFNALYYLDN